MTEEDIDVIAEVISQTVKTHTAPLIERLKALEDRPIGASYKGIFEDGATYRAGDLVTRSGALWLVVKDTCLSPAALPTSWKLIVKSGQAA